MVRVGDSEGLEKIYNTQGGLIHRENEKILKHKRLEYGIYKSVGKRWGKLIFEFYTGDVYKTNQRIIGIREPNPTKIWSRGYSTPGAIADAFRARDMKKKGKKEFFEVFLNEIVKCKKALLGAVYIVAKSEQEEYTIVFPSKKDAIDFLAELLLQR